MRVLLTGATGFAGGYLAEALTARGVEVIGLSRRGEWPACWRHLAGRVALRACDLADRSRVEAVLQDVQPGQVYHLAGYASTGRSYRESDEAWTGNLTATRNLFEAIHAWHGRPRILQVSSGLVYGEAPTPDQLVGEDAPLRPVSPYAASKAAADLAGYQYGRAHGLEVVRVRPFNHIGPRQSPDFAVSHFARQVAGAELGLQPPVIDTGDLCPRRDLTDVRDMVQVYILLMERGTAGEAYNAGSGAAVSMQFVLDRLREQARVPVEVRQRAQAQRAAEPAAVCADCRKLRAATGWMPRFLLEQTLADTLEYWRQRIREDD
jgi:GDP-4-dehydro-6-deoxy-D-mannose reductase